MASNQIEARGVSHPLPIGLGQSNILLFSLIYYLGIIWRGDHQKNVEARLRRATFKRF